MSYNYIFWNAYMIHLWNFIFDGWMTNIEPKKKEKETKIEIKDRPIEDPKFRLVPDGWEILPKDKMRSLAHELTGEKYKTKIEAMRAIKKVLKKKN